MTLACVSNSHYYSSNLESFLKKSPTFVSVSDLMPVLICRHRGGHEQKQDPTAACPVSDMINKGWIISKNYNSNV